MMRSSLGGTGYRPSRTADYNQAAVPTPLPARDNSSSCMRTSSVACPGGNSYPRLLRPTNHNPLTPREDGGKTQVGKCVRNRHPRPNAGVRHRCRQSGKHHLSPSPYPKPSFLENPDPAECAGPSDCNLLGQETVDIIRIPACAFALGADTRLKFPGATV